MMYQLPFSINASLPAKKYILLISSVIAPGPSFGSHLSY
jgi:hypothetical protein